MGGQLPPSLYVKRGPEMDHMIDRTGFGNFHVVMDRDTIDVSLIRYVNRLNISTGHSPILYT